MTKSSRTRCSERDGNPRIAAKVSEVPRSKTIIGHISDTTEFLAACRSVKPSQPEPQLLRFQLVGGLLPALRAAAKTAIERYGLHTWLTAEGRPELSSYESISLTYNPELNDSRVKSVHQSTLGTSGVPRIEQYYGAVWNFPEPKATYYDTYGFRFPTPAAKIGALGQFISECGLSLLRSRLSVLYGDDMDEVTFQYGWHRDESVFENLRINIPLMSHPNFRLQIEHGGDTPAESSSTMSLHYLEPGSAYTFDTHKPHRVLPIAPSRVKRVHLVLGFAPWFHFDAATDTWRANQYYGRVHPFDIVRSGALHLGLRAAPG